MQQQGLYRALATNPVLATVVSALAIILGILVIVYPGLLAWLVGRFSWVVRWSAILA